MRSGSEARRAGIARAAPNPAAWPLLSRHCSPTSPPAPPPLPPPPQERGAVGILAAGTSDVAAAGEAVAMCRAMGVAVVTAYDVGVAGLHRLAAPLEEMRAAGVSALVVAAGMEGALPSVVAGLVDVPVIGLPTSTGYGFGGRGEAALLGMLQSCSPGLTVVNIDNGIGAGAT